MKPQSTSSYDVDNRYRFYKSLNSNQDISPDRRGVRPGVDNNSSKNFLNTYIDQLRDSNFPRAMVN
tara:strand:- start:390 stop:587 length:198 start_codon:yes stop_codon:yes gene_type:complete